MTRKRLSICLVAGPTVTFAVRRIEYIVKHDVDLTLFAECKCPYLAEQNILESCGCRVEYFPGRLSRWKLSIRLIALLLQKVLAHPRHTLRLIVAVNRRHGPHRTVTSLPSLLPFVGERFDIVNLEDGWVASKFLDLVLFKEHFPFRIIASFVGSDLFIDSLLHEETYKNLLRHCDGFRFKCRALLSRARELGLPDGKGRVIPEGTDAHVYRPSFPLRSGPKAGQQGQLALLSVGNLVWQKGYEYALQAVHDLVQRGMKLRYDIVGDGEHRPAIEYAVRQMGLSEVVYLHGRLDRDEILKLYEKTDIYLQPSVSEGFCNAIREAMCFEIPVICTSAGGLPEVVEHEITGFIVPPRDPEALAEKIMVLAEDEELRAKMGAQGRKRVLDGFTLEQQVANLLKFYEDAGEKPSTR
ncbi:MAG TPA: glycosyltransferase family 4 protein [bacterium]|nr:glycosyltransferase family 4 protein [bacterium]